MLPYASQGQIWLKGKFVKSFRRRVAVFLGVLDCSEIVFAFVAQEPVQVILESDVLRGIESASLNFFADTEDGERLHLLQCRWC